MNLKEIEAQAEKFFEFPTANKDHVTTTSAILFARHILEFADCSVNCHQFHDAVIDCQKLTAAQCAEIADKAAYDRRAAKMAINNSMEHYNRACDDIAEAIRKEFNLSKLEEV